MSPTAPKKKTAGSRSRTSASKTTAKAAAPKKAAARPKTSARQRLRASVQAGRKDLATVLRDQPRTIQAMEVGELLQWDPAINSMGARRVLQGIAYPQTKVRDLTAVQTQRLLGALRYVPGPQAASLRA